jgi:hypothetical protein
MTAFILPEWNTDFADWFIFGSETKLYTMVSFGW